MFKFFERLMEWETIVYFIGVIAGLGILGYIVSDWFILFWSRGSYATTSSNAA
jgi:hypothetical protein